MTQTISPIGDRLGIILSKELVEKFHLEAGTVVEVYAEGNGLKVVPQVSMPSKNIQDSTLRMMEIHRETLDKLAK